MNDELSVHAAPNEVRIVNTTPGPVLLTGVESPDVPEWIVRPTGLEDEAQPMNPGESWSVPIGPTLGHRFFHVEVKWMDENENRHSRNVRLNP